MRKSIAAGLVGLLLFWPNNILAQNIETFLRVPWGLGIHIFQWVFKENTKILYAEVTAEGHDLESARQSAFRMAVERSVGVVISSETQANNQILIRDEITSYASGYVTDFRLVDQIQRNNRTWVKMQVWVSPNSLRDRLLSKANTSGRVEGGRITAQIESFQHSRRSSDMMLNSVLLDFPQRAFNLSLDATRVEVGVDRRMSLAIPFAMGWNKHYINSLKDAVKTINQRPDCTGWISYCTNLQAIIYVDNVFSVFDDTAALKLIDENMQASKPVLQVNIYDLNGQISLQTCYAIHALTPNWATPGHGGYGPFIQIGHRQVKIDSSHYVKETIKIPLDNVDTRSLDKVELSVVRLNQCKNPRSRRS
jgi:hypothetical protein